MSQITITLLFLAFAIIMFMLEKIPLGVTYIRYSRAKIAMMLN